MAKYSILDEVHIDVNVTQNPYQFEETQLFEMAMRINKKRSFLFISKVLGKHIALPPQIPLLLGHLLAMRYMEVVEKKPDIRAQAVATALKTYEQLDESLNMLEEHPLVLEKPVKIIGFAETATALGHAFFNAFRQHVEYVHTTRECIPSLVPLATFEEEHSHATTHRVYMQDEHFFEGDAPIALVDDELTTGQTNINIISQILEAFPHKKSFVIVSILDWRSEEHRQAYRDFEQQHGITIQEVSLLQGTIQVEGQPQVEAPTRQSNPLKQTPTVIHASLAHLLPDDQYIHAISTQQDGTQCSMPYYRGSGRFGLTKEQDVLIRQQLSLFKYQLQGLRKGGKTLVLGTGEFMYIPMRIAALLGKNVYFHSTTRSPIYAHEKSFIQTQYTFESPEQCGVENYVYNIPKKHYTDAIIVIERITSDAALTALIDALAEAQIPTVTILTLTDGREL